MIRNIVVGGQRMTLPQAAATLGIDPKQVHRSVHEKGISHQQAVNLHAVPTVANPTPCQCAHCHANFNGTPEQHQKHLL